MNLVFPLAKLCGAAKAGVVCLLLLGSLGSRAETDGEFVKSITPGERAMLPEWCLDTQSFGYGDAYSNTSPRAGHWIGLMGKTFWAAHHYCWAQIKIQRSRSIGMPPNTREYWLNSAVADMYYVVQNATPDFVLLPEVLVRIGEAYVTQENYAKANEVFEKARAVKPDYWPPYVRWAEVLVKFGKKQDGLELVERVLKVAPHDAELQRQYLLLKAAPGRVVKAQVKADAAGGSKSQRTKAQRPVAASAPVSVVSAERAASSTGR